MIEDPPENPAALPAHPAARPACPEVLRALFVTDDPAGVTHLTARLADAGLSVSAEVAGTRQAFEEAIAERTYHFVAADCQFPGWTATETVAYVRTKAADLPVILIGQDQPERLALAVERIRARMRDVEQACAERRWRLLVERSVAGMFRVDLEGSILDANPAMARMLGLEGSADLVGRKTSDFYVSSELRHALRERLRVEISVRAAEIELRRADGAPVWVLANLNLVEGESSVIEGTFVDITDRKRAEDRTAQINRLYTVLTHLNQAIVRTSDRDSLLAAVCRIAVEDGGFGAAWIGVLDGAAGLLRPVARYGIDNAQAASFAGSFRTGGDLAVYDLADGFPAPVCCGQTAHPRYGSCAVLPLSVGNGLSGALNLYAAERRFFDEQNLSLLRELAQDVSFALENMAREAERKAAEKERARLHLSEQAAHAQARADSRFRELLEAAPDAILESDAAGRILLANPAAERMFGYTLADLLLLSIEDLLPCRLREAHAAHRRCFFSGTQGLPETGRELVARRKDGSEFPVEINLSIVKLEHDLVVTCVIRDITARKHAEAALGESNLRIIRILESITDAFFALDRDWRYTYVNGKAEQILGRKREELQGRNIWEEFPDLVNSLFYQEYNRAMSEQRPVEFSAFDAARKLWAEVHVYPSAEGLSIYFQDITSRKLVEEQSGQSQRLEALGRLAGGVSHDFNNLLTIIGGYGKMLLDGLEPRSPLRKDVEPIIEAATRASALTRQLLAFSRRQILQPRVVDLNRLITKMNKMLRRVIGEDIELKFALRSDLGRIKADPCQIEQVIMNLAVNARDAMPTGGVVTIVTDNYNVSEDAGVPGLATGSYVLLMVSDTGIGMDEQTKRQLFEPFFTTKARGKGTGLGLSTVYGIVKQAGGEIRVTSEPGHGACFQIYVPRSRKLPKTSKPAAARRRPRKGSETILLVEDEPEVRRLTREMLARFGYRVIEACDAAQALEVWSASGDSVDLLLTDVIMPRMSGRELAGKLTAARPSLKVLYISGYADEVISRHGILQDDATLLGKPFSQEALGIKVRSILDAGPRQLTTR